MITDKQIERIVKAIENIEVNQSLEPTITQLHDAVAACADSLFDIAEALQVMNAQNAG